MTNDIKERGRAFVGKYDCPDGVVEDLISRIEELEGEVAYVQIDIEESVAAERKRLTPWIEHGLYCEARYRKMPCTCGLSAALGEADDKDDPPWAKITGAGAA